MASKALVLGNAQHVTKWEFKLEADKEIMLEMPNETIVLVIYFPVPHCIK